MTNRIASLYIKGVEIVVAAPEERLNSFVGRLTASHDFHVSFEVEVVRVGYGSMHSEFVDQKGVMHVRPSDVDAVIVWRML